MQILGILLLFSFTIKAQQLVETFGTAATLPSGWTTSPAVTNRVVVNSTSASTSYTGVGGASGGSNLAMSNCGIAGETVSVTTTSFNMTARTNIVIGFGERRTDAFNVPVTLEFSIDGGATWTTISTNINPTSSGTWVYTTYSLPTSANNSNLTFRFSYTTTLNAATPPTQYSCSGTPPSLRIDDFVVGYTSPLPVKLLSFAGLRTAAGVELSWQTADEVDFSHFGLERSQDMVTFEAVSLIKASQAGQYTYLDTQAPAATTYYRLRLEDVDGSYSYSRAISVGEVKAAVSVYPNPAAAATLHVRAAGYEKYTLYTVNRSQIKQGTITKDEIDISDLASGIYLIVLEDARGNKTTERILKH